MKELFYYYILNYKYKYFTNNDVIEIYIKNDKEKRKRMGEIQTSFRHLRFYYKKSLKNWKFLRVDAIEQRKKLLINKKQHVRNRNKPI